MGKTYAAGGGGDAHIVDRNSFEYKMNYNSQGKGSKRRPASMPPWYGMEEVGRSPRMVEFRITDSRTLFVPLADVEKYEKYKK